MTWGRLPVRTAALTVGLLLATLTACSSSGSADGGSPASTDGTRAASVLESAPTPPAPTAPGPTAPVSSTPAASSSATPPSVSEPATPTRVAAPPQLRSTCTKLMVRIIRGSAAAGREFAALQFTNAGAKSCTLHGYPSVTLLLRGEQIGTASQPSGTRTSSRTLAPGDTAESKLNDYTSCQAPLSDTIRVRVPGSSQVSTGIGRLRACTLRVDPLGAPD